MCAFRDALFGAKNGDSKAVELLYNQFSPLLLKCSMVNGHRDEDLYQTLLIEFLQVIQKFSIYHGYKRPLARSFRATVTIK